MNYTIYKNTEEISNFRQTYQQFTIYKNVASIHSNVRIDLDNLNQHATQKYIEKDDRKLIIFNPIFHASDKQYNNCTSTGGLKEQKSAYLPNSVMIDIDIDPIKGKAPINNFITDMGCATLREARAKLIRLVQEDNCAYFVGISANKGVKLLINVLSDYYIDKADECIENFKVDKYTDKVKSLGESNLNIAIEYMSKFGLKLHDKIDGKNQNYIDLNAKNPTLGTFTSRKYAINPDAHIITYKLEEQSNKLNLQTSANSSSTYQGDDMLWKQNNKWCKDFFTFYKNLLEQDRLNPGSQDAKFDIINRHLSNHIGDFDNCKPLCFSLNFVDNTYLGYFHKLYQQHYFTLNPKTRADMKDFSSFKKWIKSFEKTFAIPLDTIFKVLFLELNLKSNGKTYFPINSIQNDLYGNTYDTAIEYTTQYISKKKDEITKILNSNNTVVMKCEAGSGKSTFIINYLLELLNSGQVTKCIMVVPKNPLLDQLDEKTMKIITSKYNNIQLHHNYGQHKYKGGDGLILSSTPNLKQVGEADILVVDEIQNLVNYSKKIYSDINESMYKKIIYISATPEKFLIGLDTQKYFYLNLYNKNSQKKTITEYFTNDVKGKVTELFDITKKQLFFWNDISTTKEFFNNTNFGTNFLELNKNKKTNKNVIKVIKNEYINHNHVIATSFISDGINFNNEEWDDIIIVTNKTLQADEIYQISNRFRKVKDINVSIVSNLIMNNFEGNDLGLERLFDSKSFDKEMKKMHRLENVYNKTDNTNKHNLLPLDHFILKNNKYHFNPDTLKLALYNKIIGNNFNHSLNIHTEMLSYYFNVIPHFKLVKQEDKTKIITNNEELNKLILSNPEHLFNLISCCNDVYDPSWFTINNDYTQDEQDLIEDNFDYIQLCSTRYDELKIYNADVSNCINSQYSQYISNFKKKLLGSMDDDSKLSGSDKFYYCQSTLFHRLISHLNEQKVSRKSSYFYTDVNKVCKYFTDNPSDYNQLKVENKSLFKLDNKSVGRFMSSLSRFWKPIKVNGKVVYRVK